ncbi:MAG: universal stress protein [Chloroflexi bacterium]|nr:universal stress protein [Chloroflexota bacterium]
MIKHILVPLDGSEYAERARAFAQDLAEPLKASITLLMVLQRGLASFPRVAELDAHSKKLAMDYLVPFRERARAKTDVQVEFGNPAEVIADVATKSSADLIVMSTHGLGSSVQHPMLGSVALRVLHLAPCPVTMVRIY